MKKEVRGVAGSTATLSEAERADANATGGPAASPAAEGQKTYTEAEKKACSIEAMKNGEICEACQ